MRSGPIRPSAPSRPSTYRPTPPRSAGTLVASTSTRGGRAAVTRQLQGLLAVRPQAYAGNASGHRPRHRVVMSFPMGSDAMTQRDTAIVGADVRNDLARVHG